MLFCDLLSTSCCSTSQATELSATITSPRPRYAIRKGLGVWYLTFDGKDAVLKHERGILYLAYLLLNPPEQPINALDLIAKIPEIYRNQLGLAPIVDPATGKTTPLQSHARIQERSLAIDDAQTMRALLRKEKELEAILDSDDESEPVKQEALRELEAIAEFQRQHGRRTKDSAQKAADSVRLAIRRLYRRLSTATDLNGEPHPVLRAFAAHLENCVINPSALHSRHRRVSSNTVPPGCLTYRPPPSVTWAHAPPDPAD